MLKRDCGLFVALVVLVAAAPAQFAAGQEWYIPKPVDVTSEGRFEIGCRLQFETDEEGGLERHETALVPSLSLRGSRVEAYAEVPLAYAHQESVVGFDLTSDSKSGVGDVFTQLTCSLTGGEDWKLLAGLDVVLPTGDDPYDHDVGLGGGFTTFTPGLTYLKVIDPLVLFGYVGNRFSSHERFDVGKVEPGNDVRFQGGTTIYLNPRVRGTVFVAGDIMSCTKIDGDEVEGSDGAAVRFGTGLNVSLSDRQTLSFSAVFGMTDQAPDSLVSIGIKCSF